MMKKLPLEQLPAFLKGISETKTLVAPVEKGGQVNFDL